MVDWQVTAVTINCDAVADEVTIIVKNDWSVKCTGFEKYTGSRTVRLELVKRSLNAKRTLECKGMQCKQIEEYVRKLQAEEELISVTISTGQNPEKTNTGWALMKHAPISIQLYLIPDKMASDWN